MNGINQSRHGADRQNRRLRLEHLEQRNLLSIDMPHGMEMHERHELPTFEVVETDSPGDTRLRILGTEGPDEVSVVVQRDATVVIANGLSYVVDDSTIAIYFEGRGGDDVFENHSALYTLVAGGPGNDTLSSDALINYMAGDDGDDEIHVGFGMNVIWGDSAEDGYFAEYADMFPEDYVWGDEPGKDTIIAGEGPDLIEGGGGDDVIWANGGMDFVSGGPGNDLIHGGPDNDLLMGGAGNDLIRGESGNDRIYGDDGHDVLLGGADADSLVGGRGRDVLIGGWGKDTLRGDARTLRPAHESLGDILIGGTTEYDEHDEALLAILDEWSGPGSQAERIANLQSGVGRYALNSRTVRDDEAPDVIHDALEGNDWLVDAWIADGELRSRR